MFDYPNNGLISREDNYSESIKMKNGCKDMKKLLTTQSAPMASAIFSAALGIAISAIAVILCMKRIQEKFYIRYDKLVQYLQGYFDINTQIFTFKISLAALEVLSRTLNWALAS